MFGNPGNFYTPDLIVPWEFFHAMLSADFFENQFFRINLSGIPSEHKKVWIQIRPEMLGREQNISIMHLSCRTSDLQFSLVLQTYTVVF